MTQTMLDTAIATTSTASTLAKRDVSANLSANNHIEGYRTTATAGATTTLVVGDAFQQFFTGSTTQTVVLPVTSTLVLGQAFYIVNNSSGVVTVQSSGTNTVQVMAASTTLLVTCILTSGTTASSWSVEYVGAVSGGTVNAGTTNQLAFYAGNGNTVSGTSSIPAAVLANITKPTLQQFTSGTGTYSLPANCLYIDVELVGGGSGAAGTGTGGGGTPTSGGSTTFGTTFLTGSGGSTSGTGGSASGGDVNVPGGNSPAATGGIAVTIQGPNGGSTPIGSGGQGQGAASSAGGDGTGFGSGGGCPGTSPTTGSGQGGGGGGYVRKRITSPSATYAYAVGAGGVGGTGTTSGANGGNGAPGLITVYEYYV